MGQTSATEKSYLITFFRSLGMVVTVIIPMVLSRILDIEVFGSYKQITGLTMAMLFLLELGSDASLYYFSTRDPKRHFLYSFLVTAFTAGVALLVSAIILLTREQIATFLGNPDFARVAVPFCLGFATMLASRHLESYLIYIDRIRAVILLETGLNAGKAVVIIGGFYYLESFAAVLYGLAILYLFPLGWLLTYDGRRLLATPIGPGEYRRVIGAMLRYGLPTGLKNIASYVRHLHQLFVSVVFGIKQLAFYSVGCLELPVITYLSSTFITVASVDLMKARDSGKPGAFEAIFRHALNKIYMLQVPVIVFLMVYADLIITFLYSDAFAPAVLFFQIYYTGKLLAPEAPDILFYALEKPGLLFRVELAITTLFMAGMALSMSLDARYAMAAFSLTSVLGVVLKLGVLRHKCHLAVSRLIPLGNLATYGLISATVALLLRAGGGPLALPKFLEIGLGLGLYTVALALVFWHAGLIGKEEKRYLTAKGRLLKQRLLPAGSDAS